jgi:DNA-binding MarR family transcriptional regulator
MALDRLARSLDCFQAMDPQMPLHFVQTFLFVAQRHSCTYAEIEKAMNLTNSSVSRTLNALGHRHRDGDRGLGLIEIYIDPGEGRRYRARLTKQGKILASQLGNTNSPPPPPKNHDDRISPQNQGRLAC